MASKTTPPAPPALAVPARFGIVECGVFRSNTPKPLNIPFLKTLQLKTIISLTPEEPHPLLAAFYTQAGIELIPLGMTLWKPFHLTESRPISEELVKEALEIVLDRSKGPVLVIDPSGIHLSGIVVGCLRKLQHWNFAAIVVEYRTFSGPAKQRYTDEQYIELFDTDLINIPETTCPWFLDGERMWCGEEEESETVVDVVGS